MKPKHFAPFFLALLFTAAAAAQTPTVAPAADASAPAQLAPVPGRPNALPRFGLGFQAGTLGPGVQFAARVSNWGNVRFGFNDFSYGRSLQRDGINYAGNLKLRSFSTQLDWFFWKSFHLSPGALIYNGNGATGSANVPGGTSFTLGSTQYTSDASDPVTGAGQVTVRRFAPMLTFGSGNLVNREGGHFGISFEAGFAYEGAPQVGLNLAGSVCVSGGSCEPTSSASVQSDLQAEQSKLNSELSGHWYNKYFPILSLGFHYAF